MSIFEIIMLLCFGVAWPFSIHKSYYSKSIAGKSSIFLVVVMVGYVAGILNKMIYSYDGVIFLYILNLGMVAIDLGLYYRNKKWSEVSNK